MPDTTDFQKHRQEGNALYKSGKLRQAIECYQTSSRLAPQDHLPWSNLSAAYFELGDYTNCVEACNRGLDLASQNEHGTAITISKIAGRLVRVYLHRHQYDEAEKLLGRFRESIPDYRTYEAAIKLGCAVKSAFPDERIARRKLHEQLPRYMAALDDYREYYNVGHDEYELLLDAKKSHKSRSFSYLFGGIGDARHLYGSLVVSNILEEMKRKYFPNDRKTYHFTVNDVKPATHARNLVMFTLLDELAISNSARVGDNAELVATMFFIFIAPIMPRFAFDNLQRTIDRLANKLEDNQSLPSWIKLYDVDRPAIMQALRAWKSKELLEFDSVRELTTRTIDIYKSSNASFPGKVASNPTPVPEGCEKEWKYYHKTLLLLPPQALLQEHDPVLRDLLVSGASATQVKKYLEKHWMVNISLLDIDWHIKSKKRLSLSHNPFSISVLLGSLRMLANPGPAARLFDHVAPVLELTARAIRNLQRHFTVELLSGDIASVMDAISQDLLEYRDPAAPKLFDCIHLSNVPDYIGGSFVNHVYGAKLLKDSSAANIRSNCMRNTSVWKSMDQFNHEYMLVHEPKLLWQLTQMKQLPNPRPQPDGYPCGDYMVWERMGRSPLSHELRAPRDIVSRWLFAHFFKTVLPAPRGQDSHDNHVVYSPLNLTSFFRLLLHLHEIGYPPHWLADVLTRILDNDVTTAARPPKTRPVLPEDIDRAHPPAKLSTAPYQAEMSTLTVLFYRLLPFSPITASTLPAPSSIYSYSLTAMIHLPIQVEIRCQALLFFHIDSGNEAGGPDLIHSMYQVLQPVHSGRFDTPRMKNFRDEGCFMITTVTREGDTIDADGKGKFTFWMREDIMSDVIGNPDWLYVLWNTELSVTSSVPWPTEDITRGERWSG